MNTPIITIDARMLNSSGIGVVLANVASRLVKIRPDWRFNMLGNPGVLERTPWMKEPNVKFFSFDAPIFSVREQLGWPYSAASGSHLVLAPNYNIPLAWRGNLISVVHDVAHLALPEIYGSIPKRMYARVMFRAVLRKSDAIIFDSEFTGAEFRRLVGMPIRSEVIYPGVEKSWFMPRPKYCGAPYLVFVGNIKPHKNLARLLRAFVQIKDRISHKLVIVGRRSGFITPDGSLDRFEAELGARLLFTGEIPLEDVQKIVAGADALLFPSLYEGFGLPPLEAMAAGCPTIVAKSASIPEICGPAARYCDPYDCNSIATTIIEILTDGESRDRLRAQGRLQAAKFQWDLTANRYAELIDRVLSGQSYKS